MGAHCKRTGEGVGQEWAPSPGSTLIHLIENRRILMLGDDILMPRPFCPPCPGSRFRPDSLIENRGILMLDDDILMPCDDIERGFAKWRQQPERITGYYARLLEGEVPQYLCSYCEKHTYDKVCVCGGGRGSAGQHGTKRMTR